MDTTFCCGIHGSAPKHLDALLQDCSSVFEMTEDDRTMFAEQLTFFFSNNDRGSGESHE
jgi:hypothetical protein